MKVMLEIEYPNDKIFAADILPTRIVDLNYGIYFEGKAKVVPAIPVEWILKWACEFIDPNSEGYKMAMELVHDWRKENEESD